MKKLIFIALLFCPGCSFTKFVDAKGRDCKDNLIFLIQWQTCKENKEPLATTRQEIKVDANVQTKEQK